MHIEEKTGTNSLRRFGVLLGGTAGLVLALLTSQVSLAGEIIFEEDIEYTNPDGLHLKLNMARPKESSGPLPAVVCIHGGGFRAGKKERWDEMCKKLATRDYVAVTVTYRLAPDHQFPAHVFDVKAAVRWLRTNAKKYNVDPDRIGTLGDSAGGHLALFLGVTGGVERFEGDGGNADQSSRVSCVVSYYGPSDLSKSYNASVDAAEVLPMFLGGDLSTHRQRHIEASPLYWVTPDGVPTLMIHGTLDPYVEHLQPRWIYDRLMAAGVQAELIMFQGAGHGFRGKHRERAEQETFDFFDRYLKP